VYFARGIIYFKNTFLFSLYASNFYFYVHKNEINIANSPANIFKSLNLLINFNAAEATTYGNHPPRSGPASRFAASVGETPPQPPDR